MKKMNRREFLTLTGAAVVALSLAGCGGGTQNTDSSAAGTSSADPVELTVFAAASMTETLNRIAEDYKIFQSPASRLL